MGNSLQVLNGSPEWEGPVRPASEVATHFQKTMLFFKSEFMTEDGHGVDYEQLSLSPKFKEYCDESRELQKVTLDTLTNDERKAFFINIYNVLTIHGLTQCEKLPQSVLDIRSFWETIAYNIGGLTYSLNDIEHGILRANKPHPHSLFPNFSSDNLRKQYSFTECDPRIHFALVCGAKSCPPIQVYSASNIERGLNAAATSFCNQEIEIDDRNEITLSKIFQWYKKDFGANTVELLQFCLPFLSEEKAKRLKEILDSTAHPKVHYKNYNWGLNNK